jgi:hypothetical protein
LWHWQGQHNPGDLINREAGTEPSSVETLKQRDSGVTGMVVPHVQKLGMAFVPPLSLDLAIVGDGQMFHGVGMDK